MLKPSLILLSVVVVALLLWEIKALYSSWASYSRQELDEIHRLPVTDRPSRRGHFVGNLLRFWNHRRR